MIRIIRIFTIATCLFASFNACASAEKPTCKVGGCSNQICESTLNEPTITDCQMREEYSCYNAAKCEVQKDGKCGWTISKELTQCLNTIKEKRKPLNPTDFK